MAFHQGQIIIIVALVKGQIWRLDDLSFPVAVRLPQLLQRPSRTRMRGDIEMNKAAAVVLDYYEYIQEAKPRGDGNEEVTGYESPRMQARRKVDQRRSPLGRPRGRHGRYFLTVRGETRIPSFRSSSLAMRSSPHNGFSPAIR